MKTSNKRHRILKVEKRTTYKVFARIMFIDCKVYADTFYTVHTKLGCVAYNVSKKSFNATPRPGMFIRLCKNKKQFEITGCNAR
jgi:hypothetical protein